MISGGWMPSCDGAAEGVPAVVDADLQAAQDPAFAASVQDGEAWGALGVIDQRRRLPKRLDNSLSAAEPAFGPDAERCTSTGDSTCGAGTRTQGSRRPRL